MRWNNINLVDLGTSGQVLGLPVELAENGVVNFQARPLEILRV